MILGFCENSEKSDNFPHPALLKRTLTCFPRQKQKYRSVLGQYLYNKVSDHNSYQILTAVEGDTLGYQV